MNRRTRRSAATSRSVLAALTLVGGVALAGCAAGQQAQTAGQRPTIDGQIGAVGPIGLRDVLVEYPSSGLYKKGDDARLTMVVVNEGTESDALVSVRTDVADEVTITAAASGGAGSATPTPTTTDIGPSSTPTGTASGTPTGDTEPQTPAGSAGPGEPSDSPSATVPSSSGSPAPSATGSATPSRSAAAAGPIPLVRNGLVQFRDDGPRIELVGLTRQLRPAETFDVTFVFQKAGEVTLRIAVGNPDGEISLAPTVTGVPDDNEG